jgi:DNA-binding NarL/FixJ family response regulator
MQPIRVLLVDDSEEFLDSAIDFLSRDPRVKVVGRALNGPDGIRLASDLKPDLVLMDLVMPVMNGLAATRCIKAWPGAPRVVIVTIHDNAEYRRSAQEASADGFICKSQFASEVTALVDAFCDAPGPLAQAGGTQ